MLVSEFCENMYDGFPIPFYESLPQVCFEDNCGYPMEMSEVLTQLHCSNPRCPSKIIQRLSAITKYLGVKDFGEARIRSFIEYTGIDNPLLIFAYEPSEDGPLSEDISMELSEKIYNQFSKKKSMTLAEYVRLANLPFIQTSSSVIFGGFDDINEAYNEIEKGGVEYIQSKLSIEKSDMSVRAMNVYDSLMTFKEDLLEAIDCVDIIETNTVDSINLKAVVSDEVGSGFNTKAEFYGVCNSLSDNLHIEFLGSVNKGIDYLIWAGADGSPARYTNKVKKVQEYNAKHAEHIAQGKVLKSEHHIPILTASQFISELERISKEGI